MSSSLLRFFCLASGFLGSAASDPQLFAVENWNKVQGGGPTDPRHWLSWRFVSIDASTGELKGLTQWHGGTLPDVGDKNGRLIGSAWNSDSQSRNQILVDTGDSQFQCLNVDKGSTCASPQAGFAGNYIEEVKGFFMAIVPENVQPYNTLFSVYDLFSFGAPDHFATVNTTSLFSNLYMTTDWGISTFLRVVYAAAISFEGSTALYRVQRITGTVREISFPLGSNASLSLNGIFVNPLTLDRERLLVLMCERPASPGALQLCSLQEVDVETGATQLFVELPGFQSTASMRSCKSLHKESATLFLGCTKVHAVDLAARKVKSVTTIQTTQPSSWTGGEYSINGIVALSGGKAMATWPTWV